jgi:hypothetical protein
MKIIKNIFYIYLFIQILYYGYILYNKGYKFDANDPENSLEIMLRMTDPLERELFLKNFNNACKDVRCINLHGLTKEEIYKISQQNQN